jgi:uncharacterized protein with HEPN domain
MKKRDIQILVHILKYCSLINNDVQELEKSKDIFMKKVTYQHSISFSIMQIRELSNHFSEDFKDQNKDQIPVKQMVKMRNIIAHNYFSIDLNRIWYTATKEISELQNFCNEILKNNLTQQTENDDPGSPRFRP